MHITIACVLSALAAAALAQDPVPATKPANDAPAKEATTEQPKTLELGKRVPGTMVLEDIDGNEHKAASFMGKVTVVNFYSIQCPIQADWDPTLAAIQKKYSESGVVFLNVDSKVTEFGEQPQKAEGDVKPYDKVRQHLKEQQLPYTVLVDHGNVFADFLQAQSTPHVFVFAADGKLVYRGLIDDDQKQTKGDKAKHHLTDLLDKLLAGEKVAPSETKPIGCSIKRIGQGGNKARAPRDSAPKPDGGK
jgi:thiol-disulfide isomerase/thioredoxin